MRARAEEGFGLIELVIAMTVMNVAILALVGAFNAGALSIARASHISTASVLGDKQMELYRALTYDQIALDSTQLSGVDTTYLCDEALGTSCPNSASSEVQQTCSGSPLPAQCLPSQDVTGPDGGNYRIDTYIGSVPAGTLSGENFRAYKVVTVVVRNADDLSAAPYVREQSTFDQATG